MKKVIDEEMSQQHKRNVLLVLTGPTGGGKDSLFVKLGENHPNMQHVITTTSREMRPNESEGNPYHFISRDMFEAMIAEGKFFEWVEFRGHLYGTPKQTLEEALASGNDVIWHIDTKGVKNIKDKVKQMVKRSVFIFLTAPTIASLEQRVRKDEGKVLHRWNEALVHWEMEQYDDCDYLIVNEDGKLEKAVADVEAVIEAKRLEIISTPS